MNVLVAFGIVAIVSIVIKYACDSFEQSAAYLGRNMSEGVKGGFINAVGSSLPEMMTTFIFLFLVKDEASFAAGVSVTVGSAVFNAVVIPLCCILAVRYLGSNGEKIKEFTISKIALRRDGMWLLLAEAVLIFFLAQFKLFEWWMGGALLLVYGGYLIHMFKSVSNDGEDDYEYESLESGSVLSAILKFDFNRLLWGDRPVTAVSASVNLALSVVVITVACHFLSESVIDIAKGLDIPLYLSALVIGAAATSVPDTFLSINDALKGEYDDAVSNAFGSNTFDITVALGLPLMVYGLIHGSVPMPASDGIAVLRVILVGITMVVLSLLYFPRKVNGITALALTALFGVWVGYVAWAL